MPTDRPKLPDFMKWEQLDSLVGSIRTRSLVARPKTVDDCRQAIDWCRDHGLSVCARGAGRTYGDLALNDGHALLDMSGMNRLLEFDVENARVTVEAGMRLIDVYEEMHHHNMYLPSSPTESHSSVAGALCANVNGKEAWRVGSFAHQVVRLSMLLANGETVEIDREHELFTAVVGGLGMLGVILDVTLQLKRIPSPWVHIDRLPATDVDELLEKMVEVEKNYDAAVVWVDAYSGGAQTGRSVIHAAKWIDHPENQDERREILRAGYKRLDDHRRFGLALHEKLGPMLTFMLEAQQPMMYFFNRLYYALSKLAVWTGRNSNSELFLRFAFEASFTVPPAHLVCGPHGYTVQLTFPREGARETIIEMMKICQASPCPPVTTILRAHKPDDCLISFSQDGYSLNFEFHPKRRHEKGSREAVDLLIAATVKRGGKIHLAKDQVLKPEQFYKVYPRYRELLDIKARLDPDGMFTSDLARRVGIDPVLLKEQAD